MSNVVSPRGPLPPRIYWRRRLLLLAVVVGVVVLAGQLLDGGDDTEPVAERREPAAAPATTTRPAAPGGGAARETSRRQGRQPARRVRTDAPEASLSGPTGPLAQPVGPCPAAAVSVVPDVEDTPASAPVPLRLGLSTAGAQACTFEFGPDSVALRITSGDDLIWESLKCPSAIDEQSVVVRPGWLTYVEVSWSGRRATEGCAATGDFAAPGYYWAEAAAIGGEPQRSQFALETPPKPKPEPKPETNTKPAPKPSAEPTDDADAGARDRGPRDEGARPGEEVRRDEPSAGRTKEDEPVRTSRVGG